MLDAGGVDINIQLVSINTKHTSCGSTLPREDNSLGTSNDKSCTNWFSLIIKNLLLLTDIGWRRHTKHVRFLWRMMCITAIWNTFKIKNLPQWDNTALWPFFLFYIHQKLAVKLSGHSNFSLWAQSNWPQMLIMVTDKLLSSDWSESAHTDLWLVNPFRPQSRSA